MDNRWWGDSARAEGTQEQHDAGAWQQSAVGQHTSRHLLLFASKTVAAARIIE
jgi:hypothetical protein